jgi:uncharacterized membrane protein (DUF2068 family)
VQRAARAGVYSARRVIDHARFATAVRRDFKASMSANTTLRLASCCAAAYGALLASGVVHHFERTGSFRALAHSLGRPTLWVALLVAALVTWGLWKRYAWAWWLGVAAAAYQLFEIVWPYLHGRGFGRVPGFSTLLALALLLLLLVLLLQRPARLGANR